MTPRDRSIWTREQRRWRWLATAACVACGLAIVAAPLVAAPPRVIKAEPDDGDDEVAASLAKIRIEFDQDMQRAGFSFCGSETGITGRPQWKSAGHRSAA